MLIFIGSNTRHTSFIDIEVRRLDGFSVHRLIGKTELELIGWQTELDLVVRPKGLGVERESILCLEEVFSLNEINL